MLSNAYSNPLVATAPLEKVRGLKYWVQRILDGAGKELQIPGLPGRDVEIVPIRALPPRPGLSYVEGQARLLHDLANIELQAMELAFRTMIEFGTCDPEFLRELSRITLDEGRHFQMCLEGLVQLGFPWGTWPVHLSLWNSVQADDSILDRILMVHRYQEGGGLDAGERILQKISGVHAPIVRAILEVIFTEELGHVQFGSRWYRHFCALENLDAEKDFQERLCRLITRMPVRKERLARNLRMRAGFSEGELEVLESIQRKENGSLKRGSAAQL
ncbi:MAG: ferritin-like domain-containing protein [Bdellovibrionales bacterium]|nr:ferritin-like domain-containing protein [Bdellovibrionales bacterium]